MRSGEARGALDGDVVGLGGAGGEDDFPDVGPDQGGDVGARVLDGRFGFPPHDMFGAVRITVLFGEVGQHRLNDARDRSAWSPGYPDRRAGWDGMAFRAWL